MNEIKKALEFATEIHKGTLRKFGGNDFISHPKNVVKILKKYTNDEDILVAAYLHDTVEDTSTTIEEIEEKFGKSVAELVLEMTNEEDKKKEMGKAPYIAYKINQMSPKARLIKLADRLDNVSDLGITSKEFSSYYANNTNYILNHLQIEFTDDERELISKIRERIQPFITESE